MENISTLANFVLVIRNRYLDTPYYIVTSLLSERGCHTNNGKSALFFAKTGKINVAVKWRYNEHSANIRLSLGHITQQHIHAKIEDLINTTAVLSKTCFEQRGMLHQEYQLFWPNQTVKMLRAF